MKKLFVMMIAFIIFLSFMSSMSLAMTYFVRPDGGDAIQCTGTIDAPYPGTGTNQPCAWSHPFWALIDNGDETASWRLTGGDTLLIHQGSYMIGYGAPNSGWCSQDWTSGCYFPPFPSGPDPLNPTRILGAGWDAGCTIPPELWGTETSGTMAGILTAELLHSGDGSLSGTDVLRRSPVICQTTVGPKVLVVMEMALVLDAQAGIGL